MALYKENQSNEILTDLAGRNQNWDAIDAQLAEKVQNFKIKNIITNGNFDNNTVGFTIQNASVDLVAGILKLTSTSYSSSRAGRVTQGFTRVINDTYYLASRVKADTNQVRISHNAAVLGQQHSGSNLFELLSMTFKPTIAGSIITEVSDFRTAGWTPFEVDWMITVNLTETFGSGNEPTKEEMDRLVEMVPNQLWDGELDLTQQQYVNWLLSFIREKANKVQEAWITPTLINGATVYGGSSVGYYKDQFGVVHLRGRIVPPVVYTQMFLLPVGYRPPQDLNFPCFDRDIKANGVEIGRISGYVLNFAIPTAYLSLDGISFKAV